MGQGYTAESGGATMNENSYRDRAEFYRPTDPAQLAAEVTRLTRQGLKVRDIAAALKLNPAEVATILVQHSLRNVSHP